MCGGTGERSKRMTYAEGLSPRVRGNLPLEAVPYQPKRSIPACAGEPPRQHPRRRCPPVYPRVCGGTVRPPTVPHDCRGLSPRVRGNRPGKSNCNRIRRSIPACAGEPRGNRPRRGSPTVYPRVCGGTWRAADRSRGQWGLSPRVRGNPTILLIAAVGLRSIPACAGEPFVIRFNASAYTVYPRVCGGTSMLWAQWRTRLGLSPRVRGNRTGTANPAAFLRSIPACAGEPSAALLAARPPTVYPRVCGGTCRRVGER